MFEDARNVPHVSPIWFGKQKRYLNARFDISPNADNACKEQVKTTKTKLMNRSVFLKKLLYFKIFSIFILYPGHKLPYLSRFLTHSNTFIII